MNFVSELSPQPYAFGSTRCGDHAVAVLRQNLGDQFANAAVVFHEQNSFFSSHDMLRRGRNNWDFIGSPINARQADIERCPSLGLTVCPNISTALLHDAVHR